MTSDNYEPVELWECQRKGCGQIVESRETHDLWHENGDAIDSQ